LTSRLEAPSPRPRIFRESYCFSQPVQVCNRVHSWGLIAVVAEGGEGIVDKGRSFWALGVVGRSLNVLVPRVLIVGHTGGGWERLLRSWWSIMVLRLRFEYALMRFPSPPLERQSMTVNPPREAPNSTMKLATNARCRTASTVSHAHNSSRLGQSRQR
jgi:hypothetical protein